MSNLSHYKNHSISIQARVTANAKTERIKKTTNSNGYVVYKIYVTVPAEGGKANKSIISVISKMFKVAKSHVTIVYGHTSRDKIINLVLPLGNKNVFINS